MRQNYSRTVRSLNVRLGVCLATNPMVIPESERFAGLRDLITEFVDVVAAIRDAYPKLAQEWPQFFLFLSYPWIVDETLLSDDQKQFLERRKQEIAELKFDGAAGKKKLEKVLARDKHIAECCPTLLHLANFLDSFFITATADAKRQGASQDRLDFAYSEFESLTYRQGRFKRISLSHLFNFDMEGNSATFAADNAQANVRIERLDASTIPGILGESGFQAFLHPAGIGDCFVVDEEGASAVDDYKWLLEKRQKALTFAQVLQYFQDGVVHVGYSAPFFLPNWANQIRRAGLFFLGEPRRFSYEGAKKMYMVRAAEKERLSRWWKAATTERIVNYVANKKGKLRQAIYRAGQYYESSHERADNVERLLALAVAIESLFSPSDKGELKFRISQSAAQLVGREPDEREQVFKSIAKMYDRRSALVHGSYDVDDYDAGRFVTTTEIDDWTAHVRRALLGFLALYFKGDMQASREPVLQRILSANFSDVEGDKLRKEADLETVFTELIVGSRNKS
jgi:Apea-like HEPN